MSVTVGCPACGGQLRAPNQLLGRMAKCPQCGQIIKVVQTAAPLPLSSPAAADALGEATRSGDSTREPAAALSGSRRVRGLVIAGTALTLVAVVIAMFWLGQLSSVVVRRADPAARQQDFKETVRASGAGANQEQSGPAQPESTAEKEAPWADASQGAIRRGDVRVQLTAATVRNVMLRDILGEETVSPTKQLALSIRIINASPTRTIAFLGWSGGAAVNPLTLMELHGQGGGSKTSPAATRMTPEGHAARLTDNMGNLYRCLRPDLGTQIPGQVCTATALAPGKELEELLVFEPPVDSIGFLRLELPAAAFGGSGSLRLQIPQHMICR